MAGMIVKLDAKITWATFRDPASDRLVAASPALGITLSGENRGALKEAIEEALDTLFTDLFLTNRLDKFLRSHGWGIQSVSPSRRALSVRFLVPWQITQRRGVPRDLKSG